MRVGVSGGDCCSQHGDWVGQVDEPGPKGVTSCLGNVTAARERVRGSEIPSYTGHGGGWGDMNQQISPVVVVSVLVLAIALQYCVPCMPYLTYTNLLQKERERGGERRNWVTALSALGSASDTHLLSQPLLPNIPSHHSPSFLPHLC